MKADLFNEEILRAALADLSPGGLRFYPKVTSTNDLALGWAADGAPDLSLVIADEQTKGRGRGNAQWYSPAGTCLAFSLVLRPDLEQALSVRLFTGLAALAVVEAILKLDGSLPAQIKWPNDVLVRGKKCCGILTEAAWLGNNLEYLVVGVGVNVHPGSEVYPGGQHLPATCLVNETSSEISRSALMHDILLNLKVWRDRMGEALFIQEWEKYLAYRGEDVIVTSTEWGERRGVIQGLEFDGSLRLQDSSGEALHIHTGSLRLKPTPL